MSTLRETSVAEPAEEPTPQEPGPDLPALQDDPQAFHFFQAVRLLQRLHPERSPVGRFADPKNEVVRFGANPDLAFPPGQISDLVRQPDGRWKMTVNFLGLVGHLGVLPNHYSVLVNRRLKSRDRALLDFLDLFHHRVVSLFYGAMERARFYVPYERGEPDAVTTHLLDVLGLGEEGARSALEIGVDDLLGHVGLLAPGPRSALALEQIIADHFDVPVAVEQFVGGWYDVSSTSQCRVDEANDDYSQRLGVGALVGDEVWDAQARARIVLGPLRRERYQDFLPTGAAYQKLRALARYFSDDEIEFELRLVLEVDDVPPVRLGADEVAQLGWQSWIRSGPAAPKTAETVLPL